MFKHNQSENLESNARKGLPIIPAVGALLTVGAIAAGSYFLMNSNASAGPVELSFGCVGTATDVATCQKIASDFSKERGIPVKVLAMPNQSSLALSIYQEASLTKVPMDVYQIDVVWPGILSNDVLDLKPYFSESELSDFFPRLVENNTIGGKLLAIPFFTDTGLLFYRKDLIAKYGFSGPPQTWEELEQMAQTIQNGERASGNKDFWGYVWQGAQYEGLTCDAVEWMATHGAGSIVEADGTISVNNPKTIAAINMAKNWIGKISPSNSTGLREETTREIWQSGRAAFMRNWPYAYTLGNAADSKIKGLLDAAPLPKGPAGKSAATLGGWQLAANKNTRFPKEAAELIKYMTDAKAQKYRALNAGQNPTRKSLYQDPEVIASNPFFERMGGILEAAVSRPSSVTAEKYDLVSTAFYNAVHSALTGTDTEEAVKKLESNLNTIKGEGW
jgi:trehalose/maltose transport system substrate-binding protein